MTPFRLWQVDAFTDKLFGGNPAAVMVLDRWWPDETLQAIALENNLAETAFVVATGEGAYHIRWFTPGTEVPLCGHATLAAAHILWAEGFVTADVIRLDSLSGDLNVRREGGRIVLDFPADPPELIDPPAGLVEALGAEPSEVLAGQYLMAVFDTAETVLALKPNFLALEAVRSGRDRGAAADGVIVTAPAGARFPEVDFVSRFFGPTVGITEDPVTGSAHCMLAPYWSARLGRRALHGFQASARGGTVGCTVRGNRVDLSGGAVTYLSGEIYLPQDRLGLER